MARSDTEQPRAPAGRSLGAMLDEAWEKHSAECMWFMRRDQAVRAENADLVARALRKGSAKAWLLARDIERLLAGGGDTAGKGAGECR